MVNFLYYNGCELWMGPLQQSKWSNGNNSSILGH